MKQSSQNLIERTIELWQEHASTTLTVDEARETIENVTELFQLLDEWHSDDQNTPPLTDSEATNSHTSRRWSK